MLIRPGEVVPFPRPLDRIGVWNALSAVATAVGTTDFPARAHFALVALTEREADILASQSGKKDGLPGAQIIYAGAASTAYFPTTNLTGIRVSVFPMNAAGTALLATPGDFAATVRPGSINVNALDASVLAYPGLASGESTQLLPIEADAGGFAWATPPQDDLSLSFTPSNMSADRQVVAPSPLATLQVWSLAGTGAHVSRLIFVVEGR